jgi:hypothetical protein
LNLPTRGQAERLRDTLLQNGFAEVESWDQDAGIMNLERAIGQQMTAVRPVDQEARLARKRAENARRNRECRRRKNLQKDAST